MSVEKPQNQCWRAIHKGGNCSYESSRPGYSEQSARRWQRPLIARQSVSVSHETTNARAPSASRVCAPLYKGRINMVCAHWNAAGCEWQITLGNWVNIRSIVLFYRRPELLLVSLRQLGRTLWRTCCRRQFLPLLCWRWRRITALKWTFTDIRELEMDFSLFALTEGMFTIHEPYRHTCRF